MAQLRYLGMTIGDASDLQTAALDPRLGRFVALAEPMPVGTALDVDGAVFRVTRVDEGARSGCWLWADGAARAPIDDGPTVPTPVEEVGQVITMIADEGSRPIVLSPAAAVPPLTPETPTASPEPPADEPGPGSKKRKRRSKTVMGR